MNKKNFGFTGDWQYSAAVNTEMSGIAQAFKDYDSLKEQLKHFENISTLEEALKTAKTILPVKDDITNFWVENAKCTIIKKNNNFRICLDSDKEFICYDFV